jgi:hypothetical protein
MEQCYEEDILCAGMQFLAWHVCYETRGMHCYDLVM